ncbi:MAG TPA: helix-turn-helix domain-containing protein [Ktedonobacterales bacterium]
MPRHIRLEPYLTNHDLETRYRGCHDPVERSHWHFLWLLAQGMTATAVARVTGYSAYWVGQITRRSNRLGPDGMRDRRHTAQLRRHLHALLPEGEHTDLRATLFPWWPHRIGKRKGPRKT